jgi:hypothetical protein
LIHRPNKLTATFPLLNMMSSQSFISLFLPSASRPARRARRAQRPRWTSRNTMRLASSSGQGHRRIPDPTVSLL